VGRGATIVNEANFVMKHTPYTGSIGQPGGLKSYALPTELRLRVKFQVYSNSYTTGLRPFIQMQCTHVTNMV
jgi:hypothetical protein